MSILGKTPSSKQKGQRAEMKANRQEEGVVIAFHGREIYQQGERRTESKRSDFSWLLSKSRTVQPRTRRCVKSRELPEKKNQVEITKTSWLDTEDSGEG